MKIKAFTLSEMIVVLVVASIVISIGFSVLQMVRKQVRVIQKNYLKKYEINAFEKAFVRDFNAYSATYSTIDNTLHLKNTKQNISYHFLDKYVVREEDTVNIVIQRKKLFLDGIEVQNNSVDAVHIIFSEAFSSKALFVQQSKDAAYYINQ